MVRKLVIEFPLPPRELSANPARGGAWRKKHTAKARYGCDCYVVARGRIGEFPGEFPLKSVAVLHLHFYYGPTPQGANLYKARDADNARYSAKTLQDSLVAVGILTNDSTKYLKMGETVLYTKAKDHKGRACVEAILEWEDGSDVTAKDS